MPSLKTKQEMVNIAQAVTASYQLVHCKGRTYIPAHWQTLEIDPPPGLTEKIWLPMSEDDKLRLANARDVLFYTEAEIKSFNLVLKQFSDLQDGVINTILIKTDDGIKALDGSGRLVDHDGSFSPNYIRPQLNEDPDAKAEVFKVIVEWLGSEESAHSLLYHLATSLAPGYSAVKYVLLLGEGRNGKGVLLSMLKGLFGKENVSGISRQAMADEAPTLPELNNKLMNIVMDGKMDWIKDSAAEKTLVAGESLFIRPLYANATVEVQTNALFVEALNLEPKVRDKSPALQKRLARFYFPNVYQQDKAFHRHMTSEPMLGAFLSVLIDHYVEEHEVAEKLVLTAESLELQMEQVWMGSPLLQFLEQLDPGKFEDLKLKGMFLDDFLGFFRPWLEHQGAGERSDGDLIAMVKTAFEVGWKTKRVNGKPASKRYITGMKPDTAAALHQMKGRVEDAEDRNEELVGN